MRPVSKGVATAIVALAVVFSLLPMTTALAHASITSAVWDNPANPTRLTATADDEISSAPGDFYLRVVNAAGVRVDRNDAAVLPGFKQISVSVQTGLPAGAYSVQWKVKSKDGHEETGALSISVGGSTAMAPMAAPMGTQPAAPAAHTHDATDDHDDAAMPAMPALPSRPVTFETSLSGANMVPAKLSSTANAFARMTFNPANSQLSYTVWVSGISADLIDGLHVHRGSAQENGGHAFDILSKGPTDKLIFTGSAVLPAEDVARLLSGNLYLMLHTKEYPTGAARGQLVLPRQTLEVSAPRIVIAPPRTGDAGLISAGITDGARD